MALLSDSDTKEIKKIFGVLSNTVYLRAYTQNLNCPTCSDTEIILKELDALSDRLNLTFLNLKTEAEQALKDGVDRAPAIVVSDGTHSRVKFFGTPSGYEFSSLLTCILDAGGSEEPLTKDTTDFLDVLETDLSMQVFVTPTCPHCPGAAVLASRMARYSKKINSAVIEANEFPELSSRFNVQGVPRTVINEKFYAEGSLPESMMIQALQKVLKDNPSGDINIMDYLQND
ncbi:MAG: thioredoxin family protein [Candidatus Fermentibacteraceae bacterium]|nr:thioredoxin family protein [Candidatus Fermentibacteraceae bacterium]